MIVYATKLTVRKAAIGLAVLGGIIWGITALAPHAAQTVAAQNNSISQKLKDNAARVAYLQKFGWSVDTTPTVEMEVQIPKEFDAAYQSYNTIQMRQGLNLSRYHGKHAMLYTYAVSNYPTKEKGVTANLVLYKNRVIAADVSSADANGFTHCLTERPTQNQNGQTTSSSAQTTQKQKAAASPQKTPSSNHASSEDTNQTNPPTDE